MQKTNRKNNTAEYIYINKLSLFKDLDNNDYASLNWSVRNGYPRVTVYTSKEAISKDKKLDYNKIITAPFDVITLNSVLELFREIALNNEKKTITINCYNAKYDNGEKTKDIILQGKLVIGKDDRGVCYIGVLDDNKPKVKFELLPNSKWFKLMQGNNEEIDLATISKAYTMGYIQLLRYGIEHVIKSNISVSNVTHNTVSNNTPSANIEVTEELDF